MGRITRGSVRVKYIPVVLTVAIGVFFSSVLFEVVQREERTKMQLAFDMQAETRIAAIGRGMEHSIEILLSIKNLYESSQSVTRAEFKNFVASPLSRDRHIQALEWIPRIPKERRREYELAARAEGYPNFEIRELDNSGKMVTAAERQEYFPVYYVEPYLGNERALGLDLASSSTRLQSLLEARDTGETTATSRIKLVQETGKQFGVLIFHPIYDNKAEITRLEQRRKHLSGFGLAVLRIGDMVEEILAKYSPECIDIYIYDRSAREGEQFLHFHPSRCPRNKQISEYEANNKLKLLSNKDIYYQKTIKVGGREWLFLCIANPEYMLINKSARSREILVAGLLLTSILAGYFWQSLKGREKIEALVKERTVELSQTNAELSAAAIELEKTRDEALEHLRRETAISLENQRLSEALQGSNQALLDSINDLKKAQLQLVQSEKMSALGNLVAGVAHEINNPVGFISGNIYEAQQSIQDLIAHLNLYRAEADREEIASHAESIELDYLLADLPKMISSMEVGCDRIKNISTSLRTFSRTDNEDRVDFNLHEGIESTLLILKHRLKGNSSRPAIDIVKDYGSDLSEVKGFPGQLNQVFMNLLANAIDALEASNSGRSFDDITANPNRITIKTAREGDRVAIKIADNGTGMPPEVKERIFEQGFTTKRVGNGTGLGMAIARQIVVEKHGGSITCNSQLGKGTEFAIALPLT